MSTKRVRKRTPHNTSDYDHNLFSRNAKVCEIACTSVYNTTVPNSFEKTPPRQQPALYEVSAQESDSLLAI